MWRSQAPIPQPANPATATSNENYLSAQVQQLLAMVLPEPIVTILASLSDLLYRAVLGRLNEPPTYTSTLVPPFLLLLVTYLSVMLVYRSIKSFFSFILFSVKWFVILAALMVFVAYRLGNGNVEQGARAAAQRGGLDLQSGSWSEALQKHPAAQQVTPLLVQAGRNLGGMAAALPFLQDAGQRMMGMMQGNDQQENQARDAASRDRIVRPYRDVRPDKKRFSFGGEEPAGPSSSKKTSRSVSNPAQDAGRRRVSAPVKQNGPDSNLDSTTFEKIASFIGADFGGNSDPRAKHKNR